MMYTAAAIAMFLPLLDLHCGKKSCDLTEKKFKDENTKFKDENTTLASEVGKLTSQVSSLTSSNILTAVTNSAGTAVNVGASGGIAGHTELAAVDNIVDKLKEDLIDGGSSGTTTKEKIALLATQTEVDLVTQRLPAYEDKAGNGGANAVYEEADDRLPNITDINKLATALKLADVKTEVDLVVERLPRFEDYSDPMNTGAFVYNDDRLPNITDIEKLATQTEVDLVTQRLPAFANGVDYQAADDRLITITDFKPLIAKKYLTLFVDITKNGSDMKYNVKASQKYQCQDPSTLETGTEYVMCCDHSGTMKVNIGSYTADTSSNARTSHMNAKRICETSTGNKLQLCEVDQVVRLSASADDMGDLDQVAFFGTVYQPRTIIDLTAAVGSPQKVWTAVEC